MVEPAHLCNGDDLALCHDRTSFRSIFRQCQMGSRAVIVGEIALQPVAQMSLIENDDVIQTFPPNRADQPLHIRILPRTPGCGDNFFHQERVEAIAELGSVDGIAIAK